jgi:hypothetical protein
MTLLILVSCSKKDVGSADSGQATMNVQQAKSAAKEIPYKSVIERGLTLQFDYLNVPQGEFAADKEMAIDIAKLNGATLPVRSDAYADLLLSLEKQGLITIEKVQDITVEAWGRHLRDFKIKPTPKTLALCDKRYSDTNYCRIASGICKVKTIVKDVEYHNPNLPQSDDFRLVMGTYEDTPTDFGKSQEAIGQANFGMFKFRAVVKLNPFNQTYEYVTGDIGKIDADSWQTQNIPK